jgi:hypothetical protein
MSRISKSSPSKQTFVVRYGKRGVVTAILGLTMIHSPHCRRAEGGLFLNPSGSELKVDVPRGFIDLNIPGAGNYHDDFQSSDTSGNPIQFIALTQTSGGTVPTSDTQCSATNSGGNASARFTYEFGPDRNDPRYPLGIPVPVSLTIAGHVSAHSGLGGRGFAEVSVDAAQPPIGAAVQVQDDDTEMNEVNQTVSTSIYAGMTVRLNLVARGEAISNNSRETDFQAVIDPVIGIDPTATFLFDGAPVRFADAYHLEYSDGVLPSPEPNSVGLALLGGIGTVAALRRICPNQRSTCPRCGQAQGSAKGFAARHPLDPQVGATQQMVT